MCVNLLVLSDVLILDDIMIDQAELLPVDLNRQVFFRICFVSDFQFPVCINSSENLFLAIRCKLVPSDTLNTADICLLACFVLFFCQLHLSCTVSGKISLLKKED